MIRGAILCAILLTGAGCGGMPVRIDTRALNASPIQSTDRFIIVAVQYVGTQVSTVFTEVGNSLK